MCYTDTTVISTTRALGYLQTKSINYVNRSYLSHKNKCLLNCASYIKIPKVWGLICKYATQDNWITKTMEFVTHRPDRPVFQVNNTAVDGWRYNKEGVQPYLYDYDISGNRPVWNHTSPHFQYLIGPIIQLWIYIYLPN